MWCLISATPTFKPSLLKILRPIVKSNLLLRPNISQCLEDNNMTTTYVVTPCLASRPAMRVYESGPVTSMLGVDYTGLWDLETIKRVDPILRIKRTKISDVVVEILAFLDVHPRLGICTVAKGAWTLDVDLAGDGVLLSELSIAMESALGLVSRFSRISFDFVRSAIRTLESSPTLPQ